MAAKKSKKKSSAKLPLALSMLAKDHKTVKAMFKSYENSDDQDEQREILQQVCAALTAHAELEEELFYPALRDALGEEGDDLLDEATVEHATAKALIAELEDAEPGDGLVDAKVKVLSEYIEHHVREEEDEIFPAAKKAKGLDLDELAEQMETRKAELEQEAGVEPDDGGGKRGASQGRKARARS